MGVGGQCHTALALEKTRYSLYEGVYKNSRTEAIAKYITPIKRV
jgi:hypothetical protein